MKSKEPLRTKDERQPASEPLLRSAAKPQGKNGQGAMVHIQRTVGNQAAQRLLSSTGLTIMKPGHEQEKAAERNAEAISAGRKPEPATLTNSGLAQARLSRAGAAGGARSSNETAGKPALESPATAATLPSNGVAGKLAPTAPASCRTIAPDSRVGFSGAKISAGVNGSEGPPAGSNLNSGQPLPLSVRRFFEQKFEHDLGGVRVYVDDRAAQSAAALHASAYTVGGNIIFGRDAYKPGEPGGIKLLAHELSHVLQQSHGAPRMIQRKEPPDTEEVATTDYGNGLVLQQWPARGLALLTYRGRNWMQFAWTPGEGRQLDDSNFTRNAQDSKGPELPRFTLAVHTQFHVRIQVNRDVQQFIVDSARRPATFDLEFQGSAHVDMTGGSLPEFHGDAPARVVESYTNRPIEPSTELGGELALHAPPISTTEMGPNPLPRTVRHRVWTFSSAEAFNHFAQTHPDTNWSGIATPDGHYVAYALTEESLRRMAERVRSGHYDFEPLQEFPGGRVAELWLRGRHLDSVNDLRNLYYREDLLAAMGTQDDRPECEVFRIGNSYGRKPLTHAEAVARWRQFDGMTADQIHTLETEPGRPFAGLFVRGAADRHFLDYQYFRTRDEVLSEAARIPNLGMVPQEQMNFLLTEADREQEDPRVRTMLQSHPHLAESLQNQVFERVEEAGQRVAINAIRDSLDNYDRLSGSSEEMGRWVMHMPDLTERQRLDALTVLGVEVVPIGGAVPSEEVIPFGMGGSAQKPTDLYVVMQYNDRIRRVYARMLGDRRTAFQLALGNPVSDGPRTPPLTLSFLRQRAAIQAQGMRKFLALLESRQVKALRVEGPLGLQVRAQVYRDFGFKRLQAGTYPHHQETQGLLPEPLAGGAGQFTDMTEQLYANRVAHMATEETIVHVLEVAGMILVTVALILLANAAGAAVAGALFAAETTAFAVTETIVAGVVFTGLQTGLNWAITGRPPIDPNQPLEGVGELAGQTAFNIATFGFFRALNAALTAASSTGVRSLMGLSEAEFAASARAQQVAGALRFSSTGAAFVSIGLVQFRAEHGRWPTLSEAAGIGLESMATLALLEVGGRIARPYMERIGIWGRAIRLGELQTEIEQHMSRVRALNADIASLAAAPQTAARDSAGLLARQQTLLQQQRAIVDRLRSSLRTRGDADVVDREAGTELARIDQELQLLRQVQFLRDTNIRPVGEPAAPGDALEFSFRPGSEDQITTFYGANNVERQPDGSLRVRQGGRTLIFRPAAPATAGAGAAAQPQPQPTATTQQAGLVARQREVVARARRLGLGSDPAVQAIERLQPGRVTSPQTLRQQERLIAAAERTIGQQAATMAREALSRHRERLRRSGLSMDNVRSGALANLTDQQVGEILAQIPPGTQGLGEAELRGVLFAGQAPPSGPRVERIDLARVMELSRSAAERNFILNSFGRLMEARVPGTYEVLSTMTRNANNWRGGSWMLEYARYMGGQVAAFEVPVSDPVLGERRYDIVLTDGTRVELKDWENWFPDSLRSQYRRDVLLSTNNFANPDAISRVRWVFRTPGPVTAAEIRSTMREALNTAMDQANLSASQREQMIRAFEGHTNLVEISAVTRESVPLPPPSVSGPVPMQQQRREEQGNQLPVIPLTGGQ